MTSHPDSPQQVQTCEKLQPDGTQCGAIFPVKFKFCPECGSAAGGLVCKHCSAKLEPKWKFCGMCGITVEVPVILKTSGTTICDDTSSEATYTDDDWDIVVLTHSSSSEEDSSSTFSSMSQTSSRTGHAEGSSQGPQSKASSRGALAFPSVEEQTHDNGVPKPGGQCQVPDKELDRFKVQQLETVPGQQAKTVPREQPQVAQEGQPKTVPEKQLEIIPGKKPGTIPGQQPGMIPEQQPWMIPGQQPEMIPGQQPEMVPVQQSEAIPGQQPEMIPGHQPEMIPGQQPERIPGQQPEALRKQKPEMIPAQQPEMIPAQQPEMIPAQQQEAVQKQQPEMIPGQKPEIIPAQQPEQIPGQQPEQIPGQQPEQIPGHRPEMIPGHRPEMIPGHRPEMIPGHRPEMIPRQQPEMIPGQQPEMIPGQQPEAVHKQQPEMIPGQQPEAVHKQQPEMIPGQQPEAVHKQQPEMIPGQQPEMSPGQQPEMSPGQQPEAVQKHPGHHLQTVQKLLPNTAPLRQARVQQPTIPEQQPETIPGQWPKTIPGQQPETIPGQQPETIAGQQPETIPGQQPETIPGQQPETIPGQQPETIPGQQPEAVQMQQPRMFLAQQPEMIRGQQAEAFQKQQSEMIQGHQMEAHQKQQPGVIPGKQSEAVEKQQPGMIPGERPETVPGEQPKTVSVPVQVAVIPEQQPLAVKNQPETVKNQLPEVVEKPRTGIQGSAITKIDRSATSGQDISHPLGDSNVGDNQLCTQGPVEGGTPYNKKDTEPEVYVQPQKNQKKQPEKSSGPFTRSQAIETVAVRFHVLVSPEFKLHRKQSHVVIKFGEARLGGWQCESHRLDFIRLVDDNYWYMTIQVHMPKALLEYGYRVQYKYAAIRTNEADRVVWEDFNKFNTNRTFALPGDHLKQLDIPEWNQYDGMMLRDTGMKLKDIIPGQQRKRALYDMKLALHQMMPTWEGLCLDAFRKEGLASEAVAEIAQLYHCMEWWTTVDDLRSKRVCFKEVLQKYVKDRILVYKTLTKSTVETYEEAGLRLASAMTIVILHQDYGLTLGAEEVRVIFDALCLRPGKGETRCPDYDSLSTIHFQFQKDKMHRSLLIFIRNMIDQANPDYRWLLAMPLLHFLDRHSCPFVQPNEYYSCNHRQFEWWGIKGLKSHVDIFKGKFSVRSQTVLTSLLEKVSPLFAMDWMLPRTVLATLSPRHIEQIVKNEQFPPEAVIAMVFYHIVKGSIEPRELQDNLSVLAPVQARIKVLPTLLCEEWSNNVRVMSSSHLACAICHDLLKDAVIPRINTGNGHHFGAVIHALQMVLSALKAQHTIQEQVKALHPNAPVRKPADQTANIIEQVYQEVEKWLQSCLSPQMYKNHGETRVSTDYYEMKIWSELVGLEVVNEDLTKWWQQAILALLSNRIRQLSSMEVVETYSWRLPEETHDLVKDLFSERAFSAVNYAFHTDDQNPYPDLRFNENYRFGNLWSHAVTTSWPKAAGACMFDENSVLQHVLTWPGFRRSVSFHARFPRILTDQCIQCIAKGLGYLNILKKDMCSGSISLEHLEFTLQYKETFLKIITLQEELDEEPGEKHQFGNILERRHLEMAAFHDCKQKVANLVHMCQIIQPVDLGSLPDKIHQDIRPMRLDELCQTLTDPQDLQKNITTVPDITFFTLPPGCQAILDPLLRLGQSLVFQQMWQGYGHRAVQEKEIQHGAQVFLSLKDICTSVWAPTVEEWGVVCDRLRDGTINLGDMDRIFGEFRHDMATIQQELVWMNPSVGDVSWIGERIDQIKRYYTLIQYQQAAQVILETRTQIGLTGNFQQVEHLLSVICEKTAQVKTVTAEVVKVGEVLQEMTGHGKAECIHTFKECQPLVRWLHQKVPDERELKALVDLALIAATGQGDLEVTKVSSFHAAVTGFAPLIYGLKENAGFTEFYSQCQHVWRKLDSDKQLMTKLKDVNQNLGWLKNVREAQGNVEVSALKQVAAINARGIYIMGKPSPTASMELESLVRLEVPREEGGEGENRSYTYSQVVDLQSRLMLVAGKAEKGKEDVDTFVEIFDGVIRLANTFVKICTAGSILFKDWNAKFYCDQRKKVNAVIDFGLSSSKLSGLNKDGNVSTQILQVCQFMEGCLKQWKEYIEEQRSKYFELNHFTTEQLVILRNELAKLESTEEQLPNKVYALLHMVRPGCCEGNLREAIDKAKENIAVMEQCGKEQSANFPTHGDQQEPSVDRKDPQSADFIEYIMQDDFSEALALQALAKFGPDVETRQEALRWCMDQDDKEDSASVLPSVPRETLNFVLTAKDSMQCLTAGILNRLEMTSPLKAKLESLWSQFLGSVSTSLSDYLSVEHLGIILSDLAKREPLERPLPPYVREGRPTLIVCPQSELLAVIVSSYMYAVELPLPSRQEVLLCTANTSSEQVELLIRRAIHDDSKHIYTLGNADLLNYEVASHVEKMFEVLTQGHSAYRILVVCSTEGQDTSQLVTALENHRVAAPMSFTLQETRDYLQQHLQTQTVEGINPASACDPERCSVRLIRSQRAGVGKTLWKDRQKQKLDTLNPDLACRQPLCISLPLHGKSASDLTVLQAFLQYTPPPNLHTPRLFHIDIPHEVQDGVDHLLFNLVVLGSLDDPVGFVWLRSHLDLYVIETMPLQLWETGAKKRNEEGEESVHHVLKLLPTITCRSPQESLDVLYSLEQDPDYEPDLTNWSQHDQLMDMDAFQSEEFQRAYQYLSRLHSGGSLWGVDPSMPEGSPVDCLKTLLQYCGLEDPSWAELHNFVSFFNIQLLSCEMSSFCQAFLDTEDSLPGFLTFVVRFMIQMSRDFATRSLTMSEETPGLESRTRTQVEEELAQFQLKRRWETSPHPYIFFNMDYQTMTFLGFYIDTQRFNLCDPSTGVVLEQNIITKALHNGLKRNLVNLDEKFDTLPRWAKIYKMCSVMGIQDPQDPDPTYELTTDNVKKILAIHMRFRCGIPVVIMGETGCGKTRLVKFMCALENPQTEIINNMVLMKVHGGTTQEDIIQKVRAAQAQAQQNRIFLPTVTTVLFLDEVNTTEALGLVKEVLCDQSINGQLMENQHGLKLIAACNPYRKHSDEVVHQLEQSGLGYHIHADQTTDKLGRIPMRRLVYRVQPLPQSLLPLVWDFGQLSTDVERLYIQQIVHRCMGSEAFHGVGQDISEAVGNILVAAQTFMREQQNECSFVSLRDVERTMKVMEWFYSKRLGLFGLMEEHRRKEHRRRRQHRQKLSPPRPTVDNSKAEGSDTDEELFDEIPNDLARSLILAVGVCYYACLEKKRDEFCNHVAAAFRSLCNLPDGGKTISDEIQRCQDTILDEVDVGPNIARNQALKENVFMMVICMELRIPLFLVGKPGSSKSLAKTIVAQAMQGSKSRSELFKMFKEVYMVSYQCSPLSKPDGIVGTFRQCAQLQKDIGDLNKFVAVVVLDEVGLAEDSPRMPLKTLHPLLEDGCQGDEEPQPYMKVGFIGISNWALDPAKMNRGILVQRGPPDLKELNNSAMGICSTDQVVKRRIHRHVQPMAQAYLDLYNSALEQREFYGLRDFYSLVKMVFAFMKKTNQDLSWYQLEHAILRNFGGLDTAQPVTVFTNYLHMDTSALRGPFDPDNSPGALIRLSLCGDGLECESRYLLILTENYAALSILQQNLEAMRDAIIIFGSSFPKDQEYTQVCRNINRIKVCMETGQTVVLLNLENLYESLYDALNQYYVWFGGQRHVDLGLGTHRVKCRVHENFKLIVVAEKDVVYKKFPIPLINRLEKHFVAMSTVLNLQQKRIVEQLEEWVKALGVVTRTANKRNRRGNQAPMEGDVIIGYHVDTAASIVLQVCTAMNAHEGDGEWAKQVLQRSKEFVLWCAVPEAVVRVHQTQLADQEKMITELYFQQQQHSSLVAYLHNKLTPPNIDTDAFIQVTTNSRLLSSTDTAVISDALGVPQTSVLVQALQALETEQQFSRLLRDYFALRMDNDRMLILQCDSGDRNAELIACARYIIWDEYKQAEMEKSLRDGRKKAHIVLVIQLPRISGGCFSGFQGGKWQSVHLDELRPQLHKTPSIGTLKSTPISHLMKAAYDSRQVSEQEEEEEEDEDRMDVDHTQETVTPMDVDGDDDDGGDDGGDGGDDEGTPEAVVTKEEETEDVLQLDYDQLLVSCVQGAAGMLRDQYESARTTQRIQMLLDLFNKPALDENDCPCFIWVMKHRICLLLRDKEQTKMTPLMAQEWLTNEAASPDSINKAGTFRRAVWQCLEAKVTPMLAGLVAYADTNNNLDVIVGGSEPWREKLWLSMLANPELTPLSYDELVSTIRQLELTAIPVHMRAAEGGRMTGRLPFSWVLKQHVDLLLDQAKRAKGDDLTTASHLFNQTPLVHALEAAAQEAGPEVLLDLYLDDLIHMVYRAQSEESHTEYLMVRRIVTSASNQIRQQREEQIRHQREEQIRHQREIQGLEEEHHQEESLADRIIMMHVAYSAIRSRLYLLAQVILRCPEVVNQLKDFLTGQPDHPLCTMEEMTVDVLAIKLVVESVQAESKQLRNVEQYKIWHARMDKLAPLVLNVLAMVHRIGTTNSDCMYGEKCLHQLRTIQNEWDRVRAVKLFADIVCLPNTDHQKDIAKNCASFSRSLTEAECNFKSEKTLKAVEMFLRLVIKRAYEQYIGEFKECPLCREALLECTLLPCGHEVCPTCIRDLQVVADYSCPDCRVAYDRDEDLATVIKDVEQVEKMEKFKHQCNVYLMELVSRMCFTGSTPPDPGVVKLLLSYVTRKQAQSQAFQTKRMTIFNNSIDPTPVVRSVLLQLLLCSSVDAVRDHLQQYFLTAQQILKDRGDIVELAVLYVQCLEDHFHNEAMRATNRNISVEKTAAQRLRQCWDELSTPDLHVTKLEGIAKARFGLSVAADCMYQIVELEGRPDHRKIKSLLDATRNVCEQDDLHWLGLYLMRLIVRRYGTDTLHKVASVPHLAWVLPEYARPREQDQRPDVFLVCQGQYTAACEALAQTIHGTDEEVLAEFKAKDGEEKPVQERNFLYALFHEVTASFVHTNPLQRPLESARGILEKYIEESNIVRNKDLAAELLTNRLGAHCPHIIVSPNQTNQDLSVTELVVHFLVVMGGARAVELLRPLQLLISRPNVMQNAFLPTMPQDDRDKIHRALLSDHRPDENPLLYECPNGHPYVIGNCGRPWLARRCYQCAADIGGNSHMLAAGNKRIDQIQDTTKPGYVLGPANKRTPTPTAERQLSPASAAILRLLLHLSLYTGANHYLQDVHQMIQPEIPPDQVPGFLWEHILFDLRIIAQAIGKGVDDTMVVLHLVLEQLTTNPADQQDDPPLRSKEVRENWEAQFARAYISPILNGLEDHLRQANDKIAADERQGMSPLLRLIHERDTLSETDVREMEKVATMWRYRTRVTVEHLTQELNENLVRQGHDDRQRQYALLHLFLQKEHVLRVVQSLPRIVQLLRMLTKHYHRKIDRAEADSLKLKDFLGALPQGALREEVSDLINQFRRAWYMVRTDLKQHVFSNQVLPPDFCDQDVDEDTRLSMFLPSLRGRGLCAVALIHYLTIVHNDFMEDCSRIMKQQLGPDVSLMDVTPAHMVTYDPDHDLLPLVLANCTYSLEMGKGTKIDYDFQGLEKQLHERLIRGKAPILMQVEPMVFCEDMTNSALFSTLAKKIKQEQLSATVRSQIRRELRYMIEMSDCLSSLDLALGFLVSVGGDPDILLSTFMTQSLQLEATMLTPKARHHVQLKHTRALWLLLSHEREKMATKYKQEPFTSVDASSYQVALSTEQCRSLEQGLQHLNVYQLLDQLYECIVLHITVRADPDSEDFVDNHDQPLSYLLHQYIESTDGPELPALLDGTFPGDLLGRHCVPVWRQVYEFSIQQNF